jgi:hypothetical protein
MSTKIRKQSEAHAARVYLIVNRMTGKAFDCAMTRSAAYSRASYYAAKQNTINPEISAREARALITVVRATATPDPAKDSPKVGEP